MRASLLMYTRTFYAYSPTWHVALYSSVGAPEPDVVDERKTLRRHGADTLFDIIYYVNALAALLQAAI